MEKVKGLGSQHKEDSCNVGRGMKKVKDSKRRRAWRIQKGRLGEWEDGIRDRRLGLLFLSV